MCRVVSWTGLSVYLKLTSRSVNVMLELPAPRVLPGGDELCMVIRAAFVCWLYAGVSFINTTENMLKSPVPLKRCS